MYVQLALWRGPEDERDRATTALNQVRELLGPEAVTMAVLGSQPHVPAPSPATVYQPALWAMIWDTKGEPVGVTGRLAVTRPPATLTLPTGVPLAIIAWAGPWPVDELWWAGEAARRYVGFQVLLADGRAFLLHLMGGCWTVVSYYD